MWDNTSSLSFHGPVWYISSTTIRPMTLFDVSGGGTNYITSNNAVTQAIPMAWAADDFMIMRVRVPISGWNS